MKRLYEMNKESVDKAVIKRLQKEPSEKEKQALWVQVHLWFFELLYLEWIIYAAIVVLNFRNRRVLESKVEAPPADTQPNLETVVKENEGTVCMST